MCPVVEETLRSVLNKDWRPGGRRAASSPTTRRPGLTEVEGGRPLPLNRSGHGSTVSAFSVATDNSVSTGKFGPEPAWLLRMPPVSLPRFAR
jgi:hypothetical protein